MKLRIAIPSKGRISEPSVELLTKSGIGLKDMANRKLFSETFHPEIQVMFTRAADIPEFVADGAADVGITGFDLINEKGVDVEILEDLNFGRSNLVLAAPEKSDISSVDDIKSGMVVATEFPNITDKFLKSKGKNVKIIELTGATEIAPFIGVADLISDLTSTGTTLQMNHLKVIETILESSVKLIASKESYKKNKSKIDEIHLGIKGVLDAEGKKLIMMNVAEDNLDDVTAILPGMTGPTVSKVLSNDKFMAVHSVVDENLIFKLINELKKAGARDILVLPIEKII